MDYGGEFVASVVRIVERAVVAAKREGVIVADEYKEEGSVAGAAHEALTQVMSKALGLNVGGKIGIARKGIAQTVVYPPCAHAALPVAMVSL